MATELGVAYLSIAASTGTLGRDVRKSFGDIETGADRTGKKVGGSLGGGLRKGLKWGVAGIAGIGAALVGLAAKGGITRALAIEGAEKKLEGLGHSATSITKIMDNALASVRGTSYGLGDAASVAAMMTASGIKEGKDLEATLKSIADVAAISGRSLTDVGMIYGSIAARGKLQGDDMRQLMAAGIPVTQLLGKELGKTSSEISDMVSKGKIDFATFQKAMQAGMGGAALKTGETFSGALANVYAALGRLGAVVATPALASLKAIFNAAIPAIDAVTSKLTPLMEELGPRMEAATKKGLGSLAGIGPGIKTVLAPIVSTLAVITSGIDFGQLISAGAQIMSTFSPVGLIFKALAPILPQLVTAFASLANQALATLVPLVTQLAPVFAQLGATLVGAGTQIAATLLPVLMQLAQAVFPVLMQVVAQVAPIVTQLVEALMPIVPLVADLISSLLPPLADAISALIPALTPVIDAVLSVVQALLPLVNVAADLIGAILPPLAALIAALLPPLVSVASAILGKVAEALTWLAGLITDLVPPIRDFAKVVGQKIGEAITWFASLPGKLTGPIEGLPGKLLGIGKDMIQGLINGAKDMIGAAVAAIKDVAGSIINGAKDALGIHSPSRVFRAIGGQIGNGLALGITASASKAASAIGKVVSLITSTASNASKKQLKAAKKTAKAAAKILNPQKSVRASWWSDDETSSATTDRMLRSLTSSGKWASGVSKSLKKATLADFATARGVMAERIKEARDTLSDLVAERDGLRDQIAGTIFGEVDLASAMATRVQHTNAAGDVWYSAQTGFAGIAAHVKALAAKAKVFAGKLKDLIKAGLPASLVQQIAGMGIDAGTTAATAILGATKTEQGSLISDWKALESWSDVAGLAVADQMYAVGIAAQQGIVNGLLADDAKLVAAAESLAETLTKAVKKKLGIKSPSKVFRDQVGLMVAKGTAQGIDAGRSLVAASARGLLDPVSASGGVSVGGGREQHFHIGQQVDEHALASAIARREAMARV